MNPADVAHTDVPSVLKMAALSTWPVPTRLIQSQDLPLCRLECPLRRGQENIRTLNQRMLEPVGISESYQVADILIEMTTDQRTLPRHDCQCEVVDQSAWLMIREGSEGWKFEKMQSAGLQPEEQVGELWRIRCGLGREWNGDSAGDSKRQWNKVCQWAVFERMRMRSRRRRGCC